MYGQDQKNSKDKIVWNAPLDTWQFHSECNYIQFIARYLTMEARELFFLKVTDHDFYYNGLPRGNAYII